MGLLDAISGALTAGTKAVTANEEGKLQGSAMLRAIQMQQAELAKEQADTNLANSHSQFFQREIKKPQLGDPNFGTISGQAEADKIDAETGAKGRQITALAQPTADAEATKIKTIAAPQADAAVQKQTALAPGVEHEKKVESDLTEGREGRLLGKRIEAQNSSARMGLSAAKDFENQTKALTATVPAYAQAKNAFAEARQGNPAALKSALLSYAAVADPKAQLRQGVMNYVTQVDPSFAGTFEMALDRLTKGQLPPQIIDNMEKMVDRLHQTNASLYEQRRSAYVGRLPSTDAYIAPTDEVFKVPGITAGAAAPAPGAPHPIVQKYGITPSRP